MSDPQTRVKSAEKIPVEGVRARLLKVWLIGSAVPFGILVTQSILGRYLDKATRASQLMEVWSWFVPTVAPTLSLMIGVCGAGAMSKQSGQKVRSTFYEITLWLSIGFLTVVSGTILLEPLSPYRGVELFSVANFWISPFQALVVAALGFLFSAVEQK